MAATGWIGFMAASASLLLRGRGGDARRGVGLGRIDGHGGRRRGGGLVRRHGRRRGGARHYHGRVLRRGRRGRGGGGSGRRALARGERHAKGQGGNKGDQFHVFSSGSL